MNVLRNTVARAIADVKRGMLLATIDIAAPLHWQDVLGCFKAYLETGQRAPGARARQQRCGPGLASDDDRRYFHSQICARVFP